MADSITVSEVKGGLVSDMKDGFSSFPRHDINPELKRTPEWNLLVAQAIWGGMRYNGATLFYNNRYEYRRNLEYALGRQPVSYYDPFLGITTDNRDMPWLKGIDPEIKDYITKRINILVSKITGINYDVEVENMNPLAVDAKEDYKARYQHYIDNKEFFDQMSQSGIDIQSAIGPPPNGGKAMPELPQNHDDIELFFETDYKTVAEIGIELGIEHHMKRLKYDRLRAFMVFDAIVFGVGGLYAGMDENVMPYLERVDPGELIVPYPPDGDFTKLAYVGQVMWVTAAEFRKMATGYLDEKVIDDAISRYSLRPENSVTYNYIYGRENLIRSSDVNRMPILRYNYRSVDTIVRVAKQDELGNQRLFPKDVDYYSRPKEADKLDSEGWLITPDGKRRKIYRKEVNTVYEGYWIVNSEIIFRQGPRAVSLRKKGALGEDPMGFKIYAPNARQGMMTPLIRQCIPTLNDLQRYNLKLQQIVQRAIPKGGFIDLYALRKASLKWNNKELTDQQKVEMFLQTGWSLFTSKDRFQPGNNYKPFMEAENGMAKDAMMYIQLIQNRLQELDDILGLNQVSSASSLSPEMGKGVAQQQLQATDVALDWLYDFDRHLFEDVVETLAVQHIKSVKYGPKDYYDRVLGSAITSVLYSEIPFDSVDMGIHIDVRPTEQEWQSVYNAAEKAYDKQILTFSQLLYLREIQSIKQARRYLAKCEKKSAEMMQNNQMELMQKNADVQNQAVQTKAKGDMIVEAEKIKGMIALEAEKRKTLELQYRLQTQMLVTVEQAKQGLMPKMTDVPPPPVAATIPTAMPSVEEQEMQEAMLSQTQQAGA